MELFVADENRMTELGEALGKRAFSGCFLALFGELGAGKTALARGVAKGCGCQETVHSPTFTILNVYRGRLPVYHLDLYRLPAGDEDVFCEFEEYFYGEGVCAVEWAERLWMLPEERLDIRIAVEGEGRRVLMEATDDRHFEMLRGILPC